MSNAKILKVKLSNIPKEFKPLELSSKKTYYLKEFNQKLEMIKEMIEKTGKDYKMTIEICDFDAPDVVHFILEDYLLTSNTPTKISSIIEREALKDRDADEKGVTEEYKKAFMEQLIESEQYDVAENTELKRGNLKKAGMFSRLKPFKKRNKEEPLISEDEVEELEETKKDYIASAHADEIHKAEEVVHLSDSHEESNQAEEKENTDPHNDVKINSQTLDSESHLNYSVSSSENDINGHNFNLETSTVKTINTDNDKNESTIVYSSNKEHQETTDNQPELKVNAVDWYEAKGKDIDNEYKLDEVKVEPYEIKADMLDVEFEDIIKKEEAIFINTREKEKQQMIDNENDILEAELKKYVVEKGQELEQDVLTYFEDNKPDYGSYIQTLHDKEAVINKEIITNLIAQYDEQNKLILEKADEEYKKLRLIKESELNKAKEEAIETKKKEMNQDLEIIKERAKSTLDNELKQKAELFKESRRNQLALEVKAKKVEGRKNLSSIILDFDNETYNQLLKLRNELNDKKIKMDEIERTKEQNIIRQRELKIEEDKINLQIEENRKVIAEAEYLENEKIKSDNELKIQKEKAENKRLELALTKEQNATRQIEAKEEENRLIKEQNEIKKQELEARNRETDEMNTLVKNNYMSQFIARPTQTAVFEEPSTVEVVKTKEVVVPEKKVGFKFTSFLTGALLSGIILLPGYYVADQAGWIDGKGNSTNSAQATDDKYTSYINNKEFVKAYELKKNKADEIKDEALSQKDYVDAVKLAKMTNDNEYLMNVYLSNGNIRDLKKSYNALSYEEQSAISKETRKEIADTFIKEKDVEGAKEVNKTLKDSTLNNQIKRLNEKKTMDEVNQTINTEEATN